MCLGMCILFPKCQPKDTTFFFYLCTVNINSKYACLFHLCNMYQMTRRTQNSLFAAPSVNLPTILHGCCPDGNNVMSTSQRIPTRNQQISRPYWHLLPTSVLNRLQTSMSCTKKHSPL